MAGRQDGTPIAEAAQQLGLAQEGVRKRLQRATLAGYKQDGHWFVLLVAQDAVAGRHPDGRMDDGRTAAGRQDVGSVSTTVDTPEPLAAQYRVTPAEIEQAVARTSTQYMGDLRTLLAEVGAIYEGQLAAKDETIATQAGVLVLQQETIAELRRRLAEVDVPPVVVVAGQDATEGSHAGTVPAAHRPAQGLWWRLRRVRRGG